MNDYSRYYAILGVSRDSDWKGLRARYRRLIGQWHPDRYPADASDRELAEEHSKQITIAYQALERYYRDHGVLPPPESATVPSVPRATAGDADARPESAPQAVRPAAADPTSARRAPERYRALIVVLALIAGIYAAYHYSGPQVREPDPQRTPQVEEVVAPEPPREARSETGGISPGSTLFEVYSIQGIPTVTEGDTWHYGKSSIRFAQGKVVSWTQHPDNPLRIAREQPVEPRNGHFDVGSTKEEVRSIQGTPVTETETVWDYGPSRVYFEHNRVVRWDASPLQPLHVPH